MENGEWLTESEKKERKQTESERKGEKERCGEGWARELSEIQERRR